MSSSLELPTSGGCQCPTGWDVDLFLSLPRFFLPSAPFGVDLQLDMILYLLPEPFRVWEVRQQILLLPLWLVICFPCTNVDVPWYVTPA